MNLSREEKSLLRYGLAVASEEICTKIDNVPNKANNLKTLANYKNQLIAIRNLDKKLED